MRATSYLRSCLALALVPVAADAQNFADGTGPGPPTALSDVDLGVRATYRFTENPARACPAAEEYVRRGLSTTKAVAIRDTVLPFCKRRAVALAVHRSTTPIPGRYTCLRVGFVGNQVADDLVLRADGTYEVGGGTGKFALGTGGIIFSSGPWMTSRTNWVGKFVPQGAEAKLPTIVLRDQRDVLAGNKRDLQWCNLGN